MRVHVITVLLASILATGEVQAPPPAERVYAQAMQRARDEQKLVFVEFGASWCAPCRRLEAFLSAPEIAAILQKYFVVSRITVWENGAKEPLNHPGGSELMYRVGGGDGIPYFAIADASGRVLESSRLAKVDYPAKRPQVEKFMGLIDRTVNGISPEERKVLADFLLARADAEGSISGRVVTVSGAPAVDAEVVVGRPFYRNGRWQNEILKRSSTASDGRFMFNELPPGDYVTRANHPDGTTPPERLKLSPGDDHYGSLILGVAYGSLSVTVVAPAGVADRGGTVTITHRLWPEESQTAQITHGRSEFERLIPGDYVLSARLSTGAGRAEAHREISVSSGERMLLKIPLHSGSAVAGRVLPPPNAVATDLSGSRVLAIAAATSGGSISQTSSTPVDSTGAFEFRGLLGSRYIRLGGLPEGWYLEAVRHRGLDVTDTALDLSSGQSMDGIEVLLSDAGGQISGTVSLPDGGPTGGGAVIVFAADPKRRMFPSRFIRRVAVDDAGTFKVAGLPPGDYWVAAVGALSSAWDAPEALTAITTAATAVHVERRGRKHITIVQRQ